MIDMKVAAVLFLATVIRSASARRWWPSLYVHAGLIGIGLILLMQALRIQAL